MNNPYVKPRRKALSRMSADNFRAGFDAVKDESAMSYKEASKYKNFRVENGALTDGWGVEESPCLGGAAKVASAWEYVAEKDGRRETTPMYCDTDGWIHTVKEGADEKLAAVRFAAPPIAVNYRLYGSDVVLMCSGKDKMAVYDGEGVRTIDPSPQITSMALHYERLFVTTANEPDSVRFSDDLDPTNWAEGLDSGGFVTLADGYGKSNKVVAFLNYVYVFRDYGISRMIAYADQTEFSVSNLYVSSGRIYAGSVTVCGDRIIFLASDGLYVFDGLSTTKILPRLGDLTKYKESAVGAYFDGKYYLAYGSGGEKNDSLLVYDVAQKTAELSDGLEISSFFVSDGLKAVCKNRAAGITPCGAVFGTPTSKVWKVPYNALSRSDRIKKITEICLETATDMKLKVLFDGRSKTYSIKGKSGVQRVKVGLRGRKLGILLSANATNTRIAEVVALVSG